MKLPREEWLKKRHTPRLSRIYRVIKLVSVLETPDKGELVVRGTGDRRINYRIMPDTPEFKGGWWKRVG